MESSDDPSGYRQEFEDELRLLEDFEYTEDARAIRTWANKMTGECGRCGAAFEITGAGDGTFTSISVCYTGRQNHS